MPEFEFKSPEGKTYTVHAPAGATKEQAFGMLQRQLAGTNPSVSGPSPNPMPTAETAKDEISSVKALAGATAGGAVLGAMSPELTTGAGMAATLVPGGQGVGAALIAAGRAMRGERIAGAAAGALSGLVSEGAGQGAEALGAGKGTALGVRLGAGLLTPSAVGAAKDLAVKGGSKALGLVYKLAGAGERDVAKSSAMGMRYLELTGHPMNDIRAQLAQGLAEDAARARAQGRETLAKAHEQAARIVNRDPAAARKIMQQAQSEATKLERAAEDRARQLDLAAGGKLQMAQKVQAQAEPALRQVAPHMEMSDIGNIMRHQIDQFASGKYAARAQKYQQLMQQRDAQVAAQEARGVFISDLPETKQLMQEISSKLLNTKKGMELAKGKASVTDPGLLRSYQNLYDAVSNRRVQTGVDGNGNPTFKTFKTTFEALDAVRRKLGDVVAKQDVEGYAALGKDVAGKMYAKLSAIQEKYAGPVQKTLQTEYAQDSAALEMFSGKAGQAALKKLKANPEEFAKDVADLPGQYFRSQSGVRGLKEVLGGGQKAQATVEQAASAYAANQMAGHDAAGVEKWLKKNADWLREVPQTEKKVKAYAEELGQIEKMSGAARKTGEGKAKEAEKLRGETQSLVEKEVNAARMRALEKRNASLKGTRRKVGAGVGTVGGAIGGAAGGRVGGEGD